MKRGVGRHRQRTPRRGDDARGGSERWRLWWELTDELQVADDRAEQQCAARGHEAMVSLTC